MLTKTVIRSSWSRLKYFSKSLVHEIPPRNLGLNFYFMTVSYKLSPKSQLSLWRNRLARSTVNRKVGGLSPPRDGLHFTRKHIALWRTLLKFTRLSDLQEVIFGHYGPQFT